MTQLGMKLTLIVLNITPRREINKSEFEQDHGICFPLVGLRNKQTERGGSVDQVVCHVLLDVQEELINIVHIEFVIRTNGSTEHFQETGT